MSEPLLEVRDISIVFRTKRKKTKKVVDHLNFTVMEGETLGIVGESGCGKSVTSLSVMGLLPGNGSVTEGEIRFQGTDLLTLRERDLDQVRGKEIAMIFQDALAALNPVLSVGWQLQESIRSHKRLGRSAARAQALALLTQVGIPDPKAAMGKFPFQLSGGQRQRVMIAMALSGDPKLLIADEATTALDVTIQAQIMQLLRRLCRERGMAMLLITHDIGLAAQMSNRIMVMYAGQVVECADVRKIFHDPAHPYTKALIGATPDMLADRGVRLAAIRGSVPADYSSITGCRFRERCPLAHEACRQPQQMQELGEEHCVRCIRVKEREVVQDTA